jgi:hypothetical protein
LYREWYNESSSRYAGATAITFGYTFLLLGALSVYAFSSPERLSQFSQLASPICANPEDVLCITQNSDNAASTTEQIVVLNPEVIFPPSGVQIEREQDTYVEIVIRNAVSQHAFVVSQRTGTRTELPLKGSSGDNKFKYLVPSATLDSGEYRLVVKAANSDGRYSEFLGPFFVVPNLLPPHTESDNAAHDETEIDADIIPNTEIETLPEDISGLESEVRDPANLLQPEPEREPEPLVRHATTTGSTTIPSLPSEGMRIVLSPGVFPNQFRVEILPTFRHSSIELYVRRQNSVQDQFIGVASKTTEGWLYWLDAQSLPSGKYALVVKGLDGREVRDVKEISFENKSVAATFSAEPAYTAKKESVETTTSELARSTSSPVAALVDHKKPLIPTLFSSPYTEATSSITREKEVEKVRAILAGNSTDFNEMLRRYGSALQTGDENTLRLAESALNEQVYTVLAREVVDSEFEDSIYTLENDIRDQLQFVKAQIKKIEAFKKERTKAASSADTDEDGISDYDEYLIYNTDPKNPDTDNDGVIDGVEISLGYDPVDERSEALIQFNSPKDVSYEDSTLLGVMKVEPLLIYETDEEIPVIQSEISGYGLPNSFVTLYIFSDPIVVTVKTKDDGSFSYTFSKELEDGNHEVYAALTDNKGQIVVRSTGFRFAKTAEAYTYVDATNETATILTEGGLTSVERTYNIVAAMGVVSFGLILLMLGTTLRHDRRKSVVVPV